MDFCSNISKCFSKLLLPIRPYDIISHPRVRPMTAQSFMTNEHCWMKNTLGVAVKRLVCVQHLDRSHLDQVQSDIRLVPGGPGSRLTYDLFIVRCHILKPFRTNLPTKTGDFPSASSSQSDYSTTTPANHSRLKPVITFRIDESVGYFIFIVLQFFQSFHFTSVFFPFWT